MPFVSLRRYIGYPEDSEKIKLEFLNDFFFSFMKPEFDQLRMDNAY